MTIENGIIGALEANNGRADRLAIMGTLHQYSQGSVEVALSGMVKREVILRVSKGVYELPKTDEQADEYQPEVKVVPRWLADGLAPFQRVRMYIEALGPPKKQKLLNMLQPFVDGASRAFRSMIVEGSLHVGVDGRVHLGRNPMAPTTKSAKTQWNGNGGASQPPRMQPREEAKREVSAGTTSEKPQARANECAGDVPDESANEESPVAEIRPPLALLELARENIGIEEYEAIERLRLERGRAPCEFSVCVPGFYAVISGEPRAAFQAIKRIIAAAEGAA